MEDKDVFEKFYRNLFAKRLVNQLSASDDYELSMITELQVNNYLTMSIFIRISLLSSKYAVMSIH
jgi:hypothetical protein